MPHFLAHSSRRIFLKSLEGIATGFVEINCAEGKFCFGDLQSPLRAVLEVRSDRFFQRALFGGDIGVGESYMDGDWSSPDLISVVRLALRNAAYLERQHRGMSAVQRWLNWVGQKLRANSISGSRRNIHAHYDLGNDFFQLFLDRSLLYSCAFYQHADDSLEAAQFEKVDRICRKLRLGPKDHVLEIGTGWGGFAVHAARSYGCRVTTTTISQEQYNYVSRLLQSDPELRNQIQLLLQDYRKLTGQFDKVVSIEMFEAVGYRYYDQYFKACDRLLKPDGTMLLQTITMNDQKFPDYLGKSDWIQKYIFPGAQLGSLSGILASLTRATDLGLYHCEDLGAHYARTLQQWRERFHAQLPAVKAQGFDDRFIRMWDYYLASCAGSFLERYTSDVQLLLAKNFNSQPLMDEPWPAEEASAAGKNVPVPELANARSSEPEFGCSSARLSLKELKESLANPKYGE